MKITLTTGQTNTQTTLSELLKKSKQTILYFYPRDNTPGCSLEARDFSTHLKTFMDNNIQVVGVSKDSEKSHCSFIEKQWLTIPLISDPELLLHKKFGARGEKNNYGKKSMWTIRSTFLLDQSSKIIKERRNVKATGHVEKLIKEIF